MKISDLSTDALAHRHGRFRESDILRKVFEEVVCGCMKAGLVGGEGFVRGAFHLPPDALSYPSCKFNRGAS